jgi:uncharacterized membrane protein
MVLGVALVVAGLVGCNTSERGGKRDDKTPGKETFTVKAPMMAEKLKQGDKHTVELTLNRGKDFKQDVKLSAEPPEGLTVKLEPETVKASDSDKVTATLTAAKDAPVGEHKIKVTATPDKGNATSVDVKVKVEKAKGD